MTNNLQQNQALAAGWAFDPDDVRPEPMPTPGKAAVAIATQIKNNRQAAAKAQEKADNELVAKHRQWTKERRRLAGISTAERLAARRG
jgi:hypothetical protein